MIISEWHLEEVVLKITHTITIAPTNYLNALWPDVEEIVEGHKHQVALNTVGTGPQHIIIHVFTRQRVCDRGYSLPLAEKLPDKQIAIIVTHDPDYTMHEVDGVDDKEVRVHSHRLQHMPRQAQPQGIEKCAQVIALPPLPCTEGLHSIWIAVTLRVKNLVGDFFSLLDLIWMLLQMHLHQREGQANCKEPQQTSPALSNVKSVPEHREFTMLELILEILLRQLLSSRFICFFIFIFSFSSH